MKFCETCGNTFPSSIIIEGKKRNLCNRKNCFECSPFGNHNTKILSSKPDKRKTKKNGSQKVVAWRQRMKLKAIEYKGGSCEICGYNKCVGALQFHHLNPQDKDFQISGVSKAWETIKQELDKCVMLCANCHTEIHYKITAPPGIEPGTARLTVGCSTSELRSNSF